MNATERTSKWCGSLRNFKNEHNVDEISHLFAPGSAYLPTLAPGLPASRFGA